MAPEQKKKCVLSDHNCLSGSDSGACLTSNSSDNGSSGSGGKPGGSLTPLPECPSDSSPSQAAPTLHFYSSQEDFKYQTLKRREPQPPMGTSNNNSSCSNANNTKEGKFSRFWSKTDSVKQKTYSTKSKWYSKESDIFSY